MFVSDVFFTACGIYLITKEWGLGAESPGSKSSSISSSNKSEMLLQKKMQ